MDRGADSLLDAIFGSCECTKAFECSTRLDSAWGVVLWLLIALYVGKALGSATLPVRDAIQIAAAQCHEETAASLESVASSLPQFAISVVATLVIVSEFGVGVVIGSAIFTSLALPGVVGFVALSAEKTAPASPSQEVTVDLEWVPISRDCVAQCVAAVFLILIVADDEVKWWEAVLLLLSFAAYCATVVCTPKFMAMMGVDQQDQMSPSSSRRSSRVSTDWESMHRRVGNGMEATDSQDQVGQGEVAPIKPLSMGAADTEDTDRNRMTSAASNSHGSGVSRRNRTAKTTLQLLDENVAEPGCWPAWAEDPLVCGLRLATPPVQGKMWAWRLSVVVVFTAFFSYIAVDAGHRAGCTLDANPIFIGLIPMAAVMRLADIHAAIELVRIGDGDIVLSNTLSANVFDLLFGLGFAWLLRCIFDDDVSLKNNNNVVVQAFITLILASLLMLFFLAMSDWQLSRPSSMLLLFGYFIFSVWFLVAYVTVDN